MTHVWLDWLVKVAVATAIVTLLALAAGLDQARAAAMDMPADRSAFRIPAVVLASAFLSAVSACVRLRVRAGHTRCLSGLGG